MGLPSCAETQISRAADALGHRVAMPSDAM